MISMARSTSAQLRTLRAQQPLRGESALELCSAGNGGQSASGAVKGEGGPVSFGVWWWCRRFFCFGGTGASQLPGL